MPMRSEEVGFEYLEEALVAPDRLLVFLDDSELDGLFESGIALFGGVVVRSNDYVRIEQDVADILADFPGVKELHAVEMVNPKKTHEGWTQYPDQAKRASAFDRAFGCLAATTLVAPFQHLRRDQLPQIIADHLEPGQVLDRRLRKPEVAIREVALTLLVKVVRERLGDQTMVVVQDSSTPGNKVETCFVPSVGAFEQAVFHVESHHLAGVQLADLALYAVNRYTRHRVNEQRTGVPPTGPIARAIDKGFQAIADRVVPLVREL